MKVVVIGAGISGATSAFRIKRKYPEAEIKILYSESSPNTTSDIAAGWWGGIDKLSTHDVTTDHDQGGSRTWTLTLSPGWWPSGQAPPTPCWRPSAGATRWRRWGPGCQMTWGQWTPSWGIITPCGQVQCPETDWDGLHRGGGLAWPPSVGRRGVSISGEWH